MKPPRSPASFRVHPPDRPAPTAEGPAREPAAIRDLQRVEVILDEIDAFTHADEDAAAAPPARRKGGMGWGTVFLSALSLLVSLAFGLWTERLIRDLFSRSEFLGWLSAVLAALAIIGLAGLVLREILAILRLRSVALLQAEAAAARLDGSPAAARIVVAGVSSLVSINPATAQGRKRLGETEGEVLDGADLLSLAERELLGNLDREARKIVMASAQRVSIVTAVSPRALIDIAFVLYEASRMIRRLSLHYGGRPGGLGFIKLVRDVISHLAVTGSIAIGDGLVEQLVGHGLAAKLSARLGEGVINGLMTVRIGIAAIETVRPMPFVALRRPSMSDFLPALTGRRKRD